jgi:uncharacterized repeat protein (TIGR03806 family)
MKRVGVVVIVLVGLMSFTFLKVQNQLIQRRDKLSEYGFFKENLQLLDPVESVIPYTLNTPLFSNYAEKLRFMRLPAGEKVAFNDSVVFEFPEGTVLIKNFYFPKDFRNPDKGRRILETRLLVNLQGGWEAWPYIWNDEQTEAYYDPAGETKTVNYTDRSGKRITTPYVVPNKNQCKGCHIRNQKMVPIGPSARQLNCDLEYPDGKKNQLIFWKENDLIQGVESLAGVPKFAVWDDPSSGSLDNRARAYLDVNCAHCHSRLGPANTSGLFLDVFEKNASHLGVNKSPVAAGRGSGNLKFDIVPGNPQNSILLFRMKTNDPAIAMPEIGREQVHKEGVSLIEEWIRKNSF